MIGSKSDIYAFTGFKLNSTGSKSTVYACNICKLITSIGGKGAFHASVDHPIIQPLGSKSIHVASTALKAQQLDQ